MDRFIFVKPETVQIAAALQRYIFFKTTEPNLMEFSQNNWAIY